MYSVCRKTHKAAGKGTRSKCLRHKPALPVLFLSPLSCLQSLALHLLLHRDYSKESSGLRNHPAIIITGSHTAGTPPRSVPIAHHPWLEPLERLRLKSGGLCSTGEPRILVQAEPGSPISWACKRRAMGHQACNWPGRTSPSPTMEGGLV